MRLNQAITTKFISATNTRPSRIKATTGAGKSLIMSTDSYIGLDTCEDHFRVAQMLADSLKWGDLVDGGSTVEGYCFISFKAELPSRERVGLTKIQEVPK